MRFIYAAYNMKVGDRILKSIGISKATLKA